jgi:hypothetical protein
MAYHFKEGDPPGICPRCGLKHNISFFRREWTGVRVCKDCWDPRHPQMDVRGVPDRQRVPGGPLPEPADVFVEPTAQRGDTL